MMTDAEIEAKRKTLTPSEREALFKELAEIVKRGYPSMRPEFVYRQICDLTSYALFNELRIDPTLLDEYFEKVLRDPVSDDESTHDHLLRSLGERAVEIVLLML